MLQAAEQVLQELEEEARANWEERAVYHVTQVTNLAGEAFETLSENRWSRRDGTEYQEELDWVMRTFQRVCDEFDIMSLPAKARTVARARQDRVNLEYQRATRVVERFLQAHGGRQEERRPPACGGFTAGDLKTFFLYFCFDFLHIDPSNDFCFCKFFAKGLKSKGERLKVEFWSSKMVKIGRGQQNYRRCRCRHRLKSFVTMKKAV